ncbi:MAG: alpha/beta hydrolase [Clostridia bacterium]|nr:alpha/beta hydrolase [Clostridia bacterium]
MKAVTVSLKEEYGIFGGKLDCLSLDDTFPREGVEWKRPMVIVVPGGAYAHVSPREGEGIAARFLAQGFHVAVLTYSVVGEGAKYPDQLIELGCAVDYVKKHAKELYVDPEEVFVIGFSAGGHLTANLAVEYASVSQKAGFPVDSKPTAVALGYPVITNKTSYGGTHTNLLTGYSDEKKAELLKTLNLDESATDATAPTFIWTTATDNLVPAVNSLRFATALAEKGVTYELHIYPEGQHGLSTGDYEVSPACPDRRIGNWVAECVAFFRRFTKEKF